MHPVVAIRDGEIKLLMLVLVLGRSQQMHKWVDRRVYHPARKFSEDLPKRSAFALTTGCPASDRSRSPSTNPSLPAPS